jgi:hypothetical protein
MNRAERRRQAKAKIKGEAVYQVKRSDLEKLHEEAIESVSKRVVPMMLYTSLMVLRDKYGFGRKRLKDFSEYVFSLYEGLDRELVTFDDLAEAIERETGVVLTATKDGFHADTDGVNKNERAI